MTIRYTHFLNILRTVSMMNQKTVRLSHRWGRHRPRRSFIIILLAGAASATAVATSASAGPASAIFYRSENQYVNTVMILCFLKSTYRCRWASKTGGDTEKINLWAGICIWRSELLWSPLWNGGRFMSPSVWHFINHYTVRLSHCFDLWRSIEKTNFHQVP